MLAIHQRLRRVLLPAPHAAHHWRLRSAPPRIHWRLYARRSKAGEKSRLAQKRQVHGTLADAGGQLGHGAYGNSRASPVGVVELALSQPWEEGVKDHGVSLGSPTDMSPLEPARTDIRSCP